MEDKPTPEVVDKIILAAVSVRTDNFFLESELTEELQFSNRK